MFLVGNTTCRFKRNGQQRSKLKIDNLITSHGTSYMCTILSKYAYLQSIVYFDVTNYDIDEIHDNIIYLLVLKEIYLVHIFQIFSNNKKYHISYYCL